MSVQRGIPRPFLKWAGGKDQLLPRLSERLPVDFDRYFEPFVGGGALFFHLHRMGFRGSAYLSDLNEELIIAYQTIRDSVDELIVELRSGRYKRDSKTFYKIRGRDREAAWYEVSSVKRTARMIYLNKTCYNGLYRVNSRGQFNVPYGRYKRPTICHSRNLRAVSKALQNVTLQCVDFAEAVKEAGDGDFVYFDPPYQPVSTTANFTSYTAGGFGEVEQLRLAQVFRELDERDCMVLESNSDTPKIRDLYPSESFIVEEVRAKRAISCDPSGRGFVTELLIRNYQETRGEQTTQL